MRAPVRFGEDGTAYRTQVVRSTRCSKNTYATKKLAKAAATRSRKATGEVIEAYHCYPCHGFHIGHPPKPYDFEADRAEGAA